MTLAERQAKEMAIHRADEMRALRYRIDDLAMAIRFIVKRVTLEPFTVKESEEFIKTMERIRNALEPKV